MRLTPPPSLISPCPDLPSSADADLNSLLANHVAVAGLYHECKARHDGLADWSRSR